MPVVPDSSTVVDGTEQLKPECTQPEGKTTTRGFIAFTAVALEMVDR